MDVPPLTTVEFVQFHPSFDYTDFMEGIKPDNNGGFVLKKGIFKKFCENVLTLYFVCAII